MAKLLDKPLWNIDSDVVYTTTATVPAASIGTTALSIPLNTTPTPGGYFTSLLRNYNKPSGTVSAYSYFVRGGSLTGDVEFSLVTKELGDNAFLSTGYKSSIISTPQDVDITTYMHDQFLTTSASDEAQLIQISLTDGTPIASTILKEFIYPSAAYNQVRTSYIEEEESSRVILEYFDGTDYSLLFEVMDRNVLDNSPVGIDGTVGVHVEGGTTGNEAGTEVYVDVFEASNIPAAASRFVDKVFNKTFENSDTLDLLFNKSASIVNSFVSVTDPTGATSDVLRITNSGGSTEVVEIIIPIVDEVSDEIEVVFKPSALALNLGFKHRVAKYDDTDYYFNRVEISAGGALDAELYRTEASTFGSANTQLVHIDPTTTGTSITPGNWIGIKSASYNSNLIRSRVQYVDINTSADYGSYEYIVDKSDSYDGMSSSHIDLISKAGYTTVLFELASGQYVDLFEINRTYI